MKHHTSPKYTHPAVSVISDMTTFRLAVLSDP